jgi:hypothetical protein
MSGPELNKSAFVGRWQLVEWRKGASLFPKMAGAGYLDFAADGSFVGNFGFDSDKHGRWKANRSGVVVKTETFGTIRLELSVDEKATLLVETEPDEEHGGKIKKYYLRHDPATAGRESVKDPEALLAKEFQRRKRDLGEYILQYFDDLRADERNEYFQWIGEAATEQEAQRRVGAVIDAVEATATCEDQEDDEYSDDEEE